jgi:hypothetical protein
MPADWQKIRTQVHETKHLIKKIEASDARVFAYPGISHFFSKPFVDWQVLGMPVSDNTPAKSSPADKNRQPISATRILHSPSNPKAKGSEVIRAMVLQLKHEGFNIDYLELQNVPNAVVRDAILQADIAIDQLYCDRPGAAFSLECISAGVLCIVGSANAVWLKNHYRDLVIQPCYLVEPSAVIQVLRRYLESPEEKNKLASQLHSVSNACFSPEKIGEKWVEAIFSEPGLDFYFDPFDLDSEMGGFAAKGHLAHLVRGIVREYGVDALGLGHNPLLQERVLGMSNSGI